MKKHFKQLTNFIGIFLVAPLGLCCWFENRFLSSNRFFEFSSQLLAIFPGFPGVVFRRCFYFMSINKCSLNSFIGFGTLITHKNAIIEENVYIGNYNVLATVHLHHGTFLASRVSIPSGGQIHERTDDGCWTPMLQENIQMISVGPDVWIGEGAVVLASVARGSLVAAGSVVVNSVVSDVAVGGNPAKVIKDYNVVL